MSDISFESIVHFGDSLTETGALFGLTGQVLTVAIPPASAGYAGQFSNGDVYSQYAPDLLGVEIGGNYAVGSARAVGSRTVEEVIVSNGVTPLLVADPDPDVLSFDIGLGAQVARYLADGPVGAGTAASLLIGANDYNAFEPSSTDPAVVLGEAQALVGQVVGSTLFAAQTLAAAGVETIILNTLPDAAFFPGYALLDPGRQFLGDTVFAANNAALRGGAAALDAAGIDVRVVEFEVLSEEIIDDQGTFGFVAPLDQPVLFSVGSNPIIVPGPDIFVPPNPAVAGFDADQIAFFDLLHPTTALHGILGSFQAASLSHDTALGGNDAEVFLSNRGEDFVMARGGADAIWMGRDEDIGFGGAGDDLVGGGRADDIVSGGGGADRVFGGRGADVVAGNAGDDLLCGGRGGDVIIDGLGSDIAHGGRGSDMFLFTEAALLGGTGGDHDLFIGGRGRDTLYLALTDETRETVEAALTGAADQVIAAIGLTIDGIEDIVFVESRLDLAALDSDARLGEADLWGLV